ncbi:MAG: hypothetical protein ACR2P2_17335 [Nakamurella sp.]
MDATECADECADDAELAVDFVALDFVALDFVALDSAALDCAADDELLGADSVLATLDGAASVVDSVAELGAVDDSLEDISDEDPTEDGSVAVAAEPAEVTPAELAGASGEAVPEVEPPQAAVSMTATIEAPNAACLSIRADLPYSTVCSSSSEYELARYLLGVATNHALPPEQNSRTPVSRWQVRDFGFAGDG